jgi:hypothetical protein
MTAALDLAAVCTGIKTRLATISGLNALDRIPGSITAPCAWPQPTSGEYDESFEGEQGLTFKIVVAAGGVADIAQAQTLLMAYVAESGAKSIKAAIEADATLGGKVDGCRVERWRDYGMLQMGNLQFVGVVFDLEVWV